MNDFFFRIGPDDVGEEFRRNEIGHYAVRYAPGLVLVVASRRDAERVWAGIAHHYGYSWN